MEQLFLIVASEREAASGGSEKRSVADSALQIVDLRLRSNICNRNLQSAMLF
jgi:hypothetical protein